MLLPTQQTIDLIKKQLDYSIEKNAFGVYIRLASSKSFIHSLANVMCSFLDDRSNALFFIEVPACSYVKTISDGSSDMPDDDSITDPWLIWNELRSLLPYEHADRVSLSLELTSEHFTNEQEEKRWAGEPVHFVKLPTKIIKTGKKGQPLLEPHHLRFLTCLKMKIDLSFLIDGPYKNANHYLTEIAFYCKTTLFKYLQEFNPIAYFDVTGFDYVLLPLQPLRDNLETDSYEVFEKDPVKYEMYARAVYLAIVDKIKGQSFIEKEVDSSSDSGYEFQSASLGSTSSSFSNLGEGSESDHSCLSEDDSTKIIGKKLTYAEVIGNNCYPKFRKTRPKFFEDRPWVSYKNIGPWIPKDIEEEKAKNTNLVILVVGAGRGPLVYASLIAAQKAKLTSLTIHIVEKNPFVIDLLKAKIKFLWEKEFPFAKLFLHHSDMREFHPSEKADIMVSELLGSFGDNELSPECLDGVCKALKQDAISIPQSYASYIQPIMSSTLYRSVLRLVPLGNRQEKRKKLESHYVVNLRNYFSPCDTKKVFEFSHYQPSVERSSPNNSHNTKKLQISFNNELDFTCHGFAGYFTAKLYRSIEMSTRPNDHTRNLISWFPMLFPLVDPVFVQAGEGITMEMSRESNGKSVWYELVITSPTSTPKQNVLGRSHSLAMEENHNLNQPSPTNKKRRL